MTDRELLERAAKAAGIDIEWYGPKQWNPLTDDGDALRLAVKLGLLVEFIPDRFDLFQRFYGEEIDKDNKPSEATRRAIVRAAAEIGKDMK